MNPPSDTNDTAAAEEVAQEEQSATDTPPESDVGFEGDDVTSAEDPELLEELMDEDSSEAPDEDGEVKPEAEKPAVEPEPEAAPVEPEPAGEVPPVAAEEPAAPTEPQKPVEPAPTQEPPLTPEPAEPVVPEVPMPSPEELQVQFQEWRNGAEAMLSEQHYVLDETTVERLELEPHKVIPELMSKVYIDAMTAAIGQVSQNLPMMIAAVTKQQNVADCSAWETFYSLLSHRTV